MNEPAHQIAKMPILLCPTSDNLALSRRVTLMWGGRNLILLCILIFLKFFLTRKVAFDINRRRTSLERYNLYFIHRKVWTLLLSKIQPLGKTWGSPTVKTHLQTTEMLLLRIWMLWRVNSVILYSAEVPVFPRLYLLISRSFSNLNPATLPPISPKAAGENMAALLFSLLNII